MKKNIWFLLFFCWVASQNASARLINIPKAPYERPFGFTVNFAGLFSTTYEAKAFIGLIENLSVVIAPNYQNTPDLPLYDMYSEALTFFGFKRLNLGLGIRHHFFDYDSKNGWFLEYMVRNGLTWFGEDEKSRYSLIPSIMVGYSKTYDSGYTVSFGIGPEYEIIFGKEKDIGYHESIIRSYTFASPFVVTKVPVTAEISLGWMWW